MELQTILMRIINFTKFLVFLFVVMNFQISFAQSDYEIVQEFKETYNQIERQIENATSLNELETASSEITNLKSEFLKHKRLLDESLYPDKFNASIKNLREAVTLRQDDFTKIKTLASEVVELKEEVKDLKVVNQDLTLKLERLTDLRRKDKKNIAELEKLIAELKEQLRKRDELIMRMMDKLMPPIMREKTGLTREDKRLIQGEEQREAVLENIRTSLSDNIKYLEATELKPGDIRNVQRQQEEFSSVWNEIGPKLVDVYVNKEKKIVVLREIDSLIVQWKYESLDQNIWRSIREEFAKNNIELNEFDNGEEFVTEITRFIDIKISGLDETENELAEETFKNFTDSTWYETIKPRWMPHLIESGLLSTNQTETIDKKIEEWRDEVYPSKLWLYILIWFGVAIIVIPGLLLLIRKFRKSKKSSGSFDDRNLQSS